MAGDHRSRIALIAAVAENGVIGAEGGIPWRIPDDLQYFKRITMGKPVIMGRRTFASIGKPLAGRANIVITRSADWSAEGVFVAHDFDEAIRLAMERERETEAGEIIIAGGESVYAEALPLADRLYLTEIHAEIDGDTFFPPFNRDDFVEVSRDRIDNDEQGGPAFSFVVLDRKSRD